jgi:two-component system LytT family response regulator
MGFDKIAIRTSRRWEFIFLNDILCCVAHGRYTRIITKHGKEYLITKVLKEIEQCLPDELFFRTHKSYLINLNRIIYYQQNLESPITLQNGIAIKLAKRRKQEFENRLIGLVHTL